MSLPLVQALADYRAAHGGTGPFRTAIPGLTILASDVPRAPLPLIHRPALCLVVQGAKCEIIEDQQFVFRDGQGLVVAIEMPSRGWIAEATPRRPFLGMVIEFDLAVMHEIMIELGGPVTGTEGAAAFVTIPDEQVNDCAVRLVRLLDRPEAIPVVAPLVMRELSFWLLAAPHGAMLRAIVAEGRREQGITAAIHDLRRRFAEPIRIEELASTARMSASNFHRQFKSVTAMTPLQYQKQLRLLEARSLMVAEGANAETAGFRVGYESQSHFSRDYARMFGAPPRRDVRSLRMATMAAR